MAHPNKLFPAALKAMRSGDNETAYQLLIELLQGEPQNADAWYWLSRVARTPAEQQRALERALGLRPEFPQARADLAALQQAQATAALSAWQVELRDYYAEAKMVAKNGRRREALHLLRTLVQHDPAHEYGWLAISHLTPDPVEQLVALHRALRINPQNERTANRLKTITAERSPAILGRAYEQLGKLQQAARAYRQAMQNSATAAEKLAARDHYKRLQKIRRQRQLTITTPSFTLARFALGPVAVYLLLLLIQSGLNPLRVSPALLFGLLLTLVGSVLVTAVRHTPHHPVWQQLLGDDGLDSQLLHMALLVCGLLLMATPYLLLLLSSLNRLEIYRATFF